MKELHFIKGAIHAIVKIDLIDDDAKHFTIMQINGGKGNEFESIFPWSVGSTLYYNDVTAWFANYSAAWTGVIYGFSSVIALNKASDIKKLTITPTVTNGTKATVKIIAKNSKNYIVGEQLVELTSGTNKQVDVVMGFKYSFELEAGCSWTGGSAPSEITVDGNESVSLGITVPNTSKVYKMTLQPTIAGAESAKITVTGTKSGYANDVHTVDLADENVDIDVFDGYTYAFVIVTANGSWTGGSAPANSTIDGADVEVAIGITVS